MLAIQTKKPSKLLLFGAKRLLDFANKRIMSKNRKDPFLHQFIENYRGSIQFSTKDNLIHKYLVFDGNGNIEYSEGIIENPDSTILYNSVKDLFIMHKNFGDITEALLENRFEMRGNLNILLKYGFLTNYINPKKNKISKKTEHQKNRL